MHLHTAESGILGSFPQVWHTGWSSLREDVMLNLRTLRGAGAAVGGIGCGSSSAGGGSCRSVRLCLPCGRSPASGHGLAAALVQTRPLSPTSPSLCVSRAALGKERSLYPNKGEGVLASLQLEGTLSLMSPQFCLG